MFWGKQPRALGFWAASSKPHPPTLEPTMTAAALAGFLPFGDWGLGLTPRGHRIRRWPYVASELRRVEV